MPDTFSFLDAFFIVVYLIVVLTIGFYSSRKNDEKFSDYFLAGRTLGWFAIGISVFAANISSEHFIGLAGAGSVSGLAVGQFELMAIFILIFFGWFLAPVMYRSGAATVPEFLERSLGVRIRKIFAVFSIANYFLTKILVSLFAAGLLFYNTFGLSFYASSILIVLITGLYSVIGGSVAVVRTQTFQGIMLIAGAVILSITGYFAVGGFSELYSKLPADFFTMFKPVSDKDYPWTGIVFGAPIIAFWYWCADQYIVQKTFSAKSADDARKGSLLAAAFKILPIFILVFPGLYAAVLFPDQRGDTAYSALINGSILPYGLKGIVIAGLLAAIMSSLSSAFNSIAILFTNDYYRLKYPSANERKLVLVGRLSTTAAVIIAILLVPFVKLISSQLYLFLQSTQSFISPPITAVVLFGLFSKKMNGRTAIITLIATEAIGISRLVLEILDKNGVQLYPFLQWVLTVNFLHFSVFLFGLSVVMILILNMQTRSEGNQFAFQIRTSFTESLSEIRFGFFEAVKLHRLNANMVLSAFILILIAGLWSIWS